MSFFLSKRQADNSRLVNLLKNNPDIIKMLAERPLTEVVEDISSQLHCSENEVEEALQLIARENMSSFASKKKRAQTNIVIPATKDDPEKTITIPAKSAPTAHDAPLAPNKNNETSVPVSPDVTDADKTRDLIKSVDNPQKTRQEALIDAVKGLKISINEVAEAITGLGLTESGQGKVVEKAIEEITSQSGDETAQTVLALVSPLTGAT